MTRMTTRAKSPSKILTKIFISDVYEINKLKLK
jgi:hypothetical protein